MSLKNQLEHADSPIRQFLAEHEGEFAFDKVRWKTAHAGRTPVLPPAPPDGGAPPAAVLGHAIGARIAWDYAPLAGGAIEHGALSLPLPFESPVVIDLLDRLGQPPPGDDDLAARLAWFAGLCEQVTRSGRSDADWYQPLLEATDLDAALAAAPAWWIADVVEVWRQAALILPRPGDLQRAAVGPVFAGSRSVGGADADLICDGTLLDVKAIKAHGVRSRDLHQILCYALLDWDDEYELTTVGLSSVRWGVTVTWTLEEVVGGSSELAKLRQALRGHLEP